MLEENLFDISQSEFPCPGQGSRPWFFIGQIGRGTALEQEFDHSSPSLGQLGLLAAEPGTNGGGQGRLVEFEAAGVDVGARIQKDGRDGPVSTRGSGVQKRLAEPVWPVGVDSSSQQLADLSGRPRIGQLVPHAIDNGGIGVEIKIEQSRVALPHHVAEKLGVAGHLMTVTNGLLHLFRRGFRQWPPALDDVDCSTGDELLL